jgi:hypothetical protein
VIEAITHVQSVDLVADPAATEGLFEHEAPPAEPADQASAAEAGQLRTALAEATAREQSLRRQLAIHEALAAHGLAATGASLSERLGPAFYEALLQARDDQHVEALIAERAEAVRVAGEREKALPFASSRPRSSEPMAALFERGPRNNGSADFAKAIKSAF